MIRFKELLRTQPTAETTSLKVPIRIFHRIIQSVAATGGLYRNIFIVGGFTRFQIVGEINRQSDLIVTWYFSINIKKNRGSLSIISFQKIFEECKRIFLKKYFAYIFQ